MIDLNLPAQDVSPQSLICDLMLLHPERDRMEQIILDLASRPQFWSSFIFGPAMPANEHEAQLGILRDLAFGWTADTLYVRSPDMTAAEVMRSLGRRWDCDEITTYSPARTAYLLVQSGVLTAIRWQHSPASRPRNTVSIPNSSLISFDLTKSLGECSAQAIVVALMRRTKCPHFDVELVLNDLANHVTQWRSFIFGSPLPEAHQNLHGCLEALRYLPAEWQGNCLYLWAWDTTAATCLQALGQRWNCLEASIFTEEESARLLDFLGAAPLAIALSIRITPKFDLI
ncbi:hypothetical protein LEP3755_66640 (plasmid) [Leptolyngbya sp. NIES-3755]|nr:hypothetical protein LEP3755_66640 [Leptolyngbya sp. NIES-3755]